MYLFMFDIFLTNILCAIEKNDIWILKESNAFVLISVPFCSVFWK
jgi:hypothetical protein